MRERGGFIMAITGVANDSYTPPTNIQDYIIAGVQPWLDGIVTETGVVRQFVAMSHGNDYTVEEQIIGQANTGGIQFDVFPLRDSGFVVRSKGTEVHLAQHMTPAELHLKKGDSLIISRNPGDESFSHVLDQEPLGSSWSLGWFQSDLNGTIWLKATYSNEAYAVSPRAPRHANDGLLEKALGLAADGHITQRIYADTRSPRVVHRGPTAIQLYLSIITGVLPPISTVSEETYKMHNIP
ncbi:hypothetical protein BDN67DRAFT_132979 [Paxillus ammoniavirescens]|nr:hypothetical protein BDN67DRAFT_132979 [Paxillus ammoniavirescens]